MRGDHVALSALSLLLAGAGLAGALGLAGARGEVRIVATSARVRVRKCGCQGARVVSRSMLIDGAPEKRGETPAPGEASVPEPGGLPELSAWLARTRARDGELIQLDAGDLLFPSLDAPAHERAEWRRRAELLVEAQGLLGVQAYVPGEFDLALGRKTFEEVLSKASFRVLAANLVDAATKKPLFPPSVVLEAGGRAVGVIGIFDPPKNDLKADFFAREGLAVLDPVPIVRALVPELRRQGAGLVVLLDHATEDRTREVVRAVAGVDLSKRVDDVDIAFCAHAEVRSNALRAFELATLVVTAHSTGGDLDYARVRLAPGGHGSFDPSAVERARRRIAELSQEAAKLEAERGGSASAFLDSRLQRARDLIADEERAIPREPRHEVVLERVALDARTLREGQDPAVARAIERFKADLAAMTLEPDVVAALEAPRPARGFTVGLRTAEGCASCHAKQTEVWRASPHARAWESLEKGQNDKDPDCVRCHSVGFREAGGFAEPSRAVREGGKGKLDFRGVQCEACHGPRLSHPDVPGVGSAPKIDACRACHDADHDAAFDEKRYKAALAGPVRICVRDGP